MGRVYQACQAQTHEAYSNQFTRNRRQLTFVVLRTSNSEQGKFVNSFESIASERDKEEKFPIKIPTIRSHQQCFSYRHMKIYFPWHTHEMTPIRRCCQGKRTVDLICWIPWRVWEKKMLVKALRMFWVSETNVTWIKIERRQSSCFILVKSFLLMRYATDKFFT